jgi:hypothetical protein
MAQVEGRETAARPLGSGFDNYIELVFITKRLK